MGYEWSVWPFLLGGRIQAGLVMKKEPMVSRTVLMPIDLYRRIDTYAKTYDISWSAAVRRLTEAQLPVEEAFPFEGVPFDA